MCFGLDIFGLNSGNKRQAKALEEQARNERLLAQASQQNLESQIARNAAADKAKSLLDKPVETTEVVLGETAPAPSMDEAGRRRTRRSKFNMPMQGGSGLGGL